MELVGDGRSAGQCGVRRPVRDTATSEPRETDSCHTCILGREKLLYEGGVSIAEVSHVMWARRQMCHSFGTCPQGDDHQPDVMKKKGVDADEHSLG